MFSLRNKNKISLNHIQYPLLSGAVSMDSSESIHSRTSMARTPLEP